MKRNKIQPSPMTLFYTNDPFVPGSGLTVASGAEGEFYIDLSQSTSLAGRRFMRQGLNWAVAGFKFVAAADTRALVSISKVPNTWISSNSWQKSFSLWNKQQMEAVDDAGAESTVAKFRDFKVFADTDHVDQYIAAGQDLNATNLLPYAHTGGEWQCSEIVVPNERPDGSGTEIDPAEYLLHMVGANDYNSVSKGILEGYADSRAYPQSPDPVGPNPASANNWMRAMFDTGNDNHEILQNTLRNDELPYPQVDYPGGETQAPILQQHDREFISPTTIGGSTRLKGGNFPCGLIKISIINLGESTITPQLYLDLVPGNHRGYLCEPMQEM